MFRIRLFPLLLSLTLSFSAYAQDGLSPQNTQLIVTSEAEAREVPDIARLSASVVTQGHDANSAIRANALEMNEVMAVLKTSGIREHDIQTSNINIYPQYRHVRDEAPTITGYQASHTVSVIVREIARVGEVLDMLVASGAKQVDGPFFAIDAPESALDRARMAALTKARERAKVYAEALGVPVKRIVSIHEGGGTPPVGLRMAVAQAISEEAVSTPVAVGETSLRARLTVVFELGR